MSPREARQAANTRPIDPIMPELSGKHGRRQTRNGRRQAWLVETLESRTLLTSPPTILDGPASAITTTSATLSASLVPNSSTATVAFEYSTDPSFKPTVSTVRYSIPAGFNNPSGIAVDSSGNRLRHDRQSGGEAQARRLDHDHRLRIR